MNVDELEYFFDLQGYVILDDALNPRQLTDINQWIDQQPTVEDGTWIGNVQTQSYSGSEGTLYQNIIEGGEVFRDLIDNPQWIDLVSKFIVNNFNELSLNESFLNVRGPSNFIGLHSGGHTCGPVMKFKHRTNEWDVGQINILMALNDCGPGDGATVVIPSSHKSSVVHPHLARSEHQVYDNDTPANEVIGATEVHLKAGQAIFFTDSICHGSAARINEGERRFMVYRYCPHWIAPRYRYVPSPELLAALSDRQCELVNNTPMRLTPGQKIVQNS
ncbi:MAG: phytanoyl-CoA dioxygenase family protein [Planctomycetes bacterium]|nr:phytanoyl-CoA dioxygenase family protein [Planctomycetota bacterium]